MLQADANFGLGAQEQMRKVWSGFPESITFPILD